MSILDKMFDRTVPGIQKALDLYWKRNEAITSNLANSETPGFRASDVSFGSELEKAFEGHGAELQKTNESHMDLNSKGTSHLVADLSGATRADGNNVDLDVQMGRLMLNTGKYEVAAGAIRKKLRMVRMAIQFAQR